MPISAAMDADRLQRLKSMCRGYVDAGELPFAQVLVAKDGEVQLRDSYGYSDLATKAPIAKDAIVRLYSMTKPITCVAALVCFERGLFLMDDPVEVHLPEFRDISVMENGELVKPKRPPNVRQLFMHTAGIGNTSRGAHKAWPAEDGSLTPPASLEEHVKRIAAVPLKHHPGDRWDYSSCHVVLGRLVEVWSGVAFSDFLQREIFGPLGIDDIGFSVPTEKRERVPRNYQATRGGQDNGKDPADSTNVGRPGQWEGQVVTLVDVTADSTWFFDDEPHWHRSSPSGGLAGTLEDYWRFCQCLLDNLRGEPFRGVRLLSRKTLELMVQNHSCAEQQPVNGAPGVGFGLGVAVCVDARQSASLASEGEFYWGGNASTYFWIDPREGVVCVFLSQVMPGNFYPLESKLRTMVNQAIVGPSPSKRS